MRAGLAVPAYVSVAWTLMVSYQLFTEKAVGTVVGQIAVLSPSLGGWLVSKADTLVFVYAFAWIFLLSSAIPSVILGKQRSILVQFFICLVLAFTALALQDALADRISGLTGLFANPFLAYVYLSVPFLLMLLIDIRPRARPAVLEK